MRLNSPRFLPLIPALAAALGGALLLALGPAGATPQTFTVTKTTDTADGTCDLDCSLREAVIAANANPGADTITLPPGTYQFTIGGWEDLSNGGDLDLTGDVTISGAGAATTIVDAGDLDRVISVLSGTADVSGVTLRNGTGNYGGGVYVQGGATLNLTSVTVSGNVATGFAGGINNSGTMTLTNSLIISNSTANETGGVLNNFGNMTVMNSTISSNTSGFGPGGLYNFNGATLTMTGSTVYNNRGGSGGILNGSGTVSITNSTISGNRATSNGGGVYVGSTTSLNHVTITGNTADDDANNSGDGGGMWVASYATASIKNTIISGNIDKSGISVEPECFGPIDSLGNNLIETVSAGCSISGDTASNVTGQSALLGPLANNGGATLTHALLAGSPAIDWASADCPPPATDQRGISRPQGNRCDIGAFESSFSGPTPPPTPTPEPSPTPSPSPEPSATATATPTPTPTPGTGTPGVSPSPTPTPTATFSPSPTPTAPPEGPLWGDVDCDEDVDSVDSLKILRHVAGLPVSQDDPCTPIGEPPSDVDCDGAVNAVDALKILRYVANLTVAKGEQCPSIGTHA